MKDLILKELDLIDNTISRLDSQMQTSKNFCLVVWTAWIGWFVSDKTELCDEQIGYIVLASALFPILFWIMDFKWRKALRSTTQRQLRISVFLNSTCGKQFLNDEETKGFPLLDPVGWLYNYNAYSLLNQILEEEFSDDTTGILSKDQRNLIEKEKITTWDVLKYKDAKWFFPALMIISLLLGLFYIFRGP